MRTKPLLGVLVLGCLITVSVVYATDDSPPDDAVVAIVEDKTREYQCSQWIERQENVEACPEGSILEAVKMTSAQAQQTGAEDYVVLTGDEHEDRQLMRELVRRIRKKNIDAVAPVPTSACTPRLRSLSQAITTPLGTTTYETQYNVGNTCLISSIADRMRVTNASVRHEWDYTEHDDWTIFDRFVVLGSNWTGWYSAGSSGVGRRVMYGVYREGATTYLEGSLVYAK